MENAPVTEPASGYKRKLASVKRVSAIMPIENADAIELAKINGWQCVVQKGDFKPGDLGVYFEIDSVLPEASWTEFLKDRGYRIRSMKLRGALSQGLLLPLSILPEYAQMNAVELSAVAPGELEVGWRCFPWRDGDDVTEKLGVQKYEPPMQDGDARGPFPGFLPKTDEARIQSVPEVLEELRGKPYVITEKVDGQSATFYVDPFDDTLHCCSRNMSVTDGENSKFFNVARKYQLEPILRKWNIAIQGELYGPGVNGNRLKESEYKLAIFNVYVIDSGYYGNHDGGVISGHYYNHDDLVEFCEVYDIPMVRVLEIGDAFNETVETLLAKAEGKYPNGAEREGIVVRPQTEMYSKALGGRLSFKAISNRFLLKHNE